MKYVNVVLTDRVGFSNQMASDFQGLTTKFVDEKKVEFDAKVVKARYVSAEGIYLTLEVPNEASVDAIQSLLGVSLN